MLQYAADWLLLLLFVSNDRSERRLILRRIQWRDPELGAPDKYPSRAFPPLSLSSLQFLSLLGVCTLLESNILKIILLNVNISMTDFHKNIYLHIFFLGFFQNRENSGLIPGQNDDPVTR